MKDALGGVEAATAFEVDRKPFVLLPFTVAVVPRDPMNEPLVRESNVDGASFDSEGALDSRENEDRADAADKVFEAAKGAPLAAGFAAAGGVEVSPVLEDGKDFSGVAEYSRLRSSLDDDGNPDDNDDDEDDATDAAAAAADDDEIFEGPA